MSLTLKQIISMQEEFDRSHIANRPFFEMIDGHNIESLEHLIVCLVGEIGEFSNIVKKISRGDFTFKDKKPSLDEELTDVFIYLIKIANQCNIDLEESYKKKLEINKGRFRRYDATE